MSAASTTSSSSQAVKWMWNSSIDLWSSTQPPEWRCYSDVENMIIKEAYCDVKSDAMLDDYLDFDQGVQIANNNISQQQPVKRVTEDLDSSDNFREERFLPNPIPVKASDVNRPGAFGDFIWEAYLLGQWRDVPQATLVERAAQGIIEEGKKIGKQVEAEQMAKLLLEKKHGTRKQIWQCCVYLYGIESFLYRILNGTLRLVKSKEHQQEWRSRLETLGLFAWFLFDFPQHAGKFEGYVYRGAQMNDEYIDTYKTAAETGETLAFAAFTSTSRNRLVAEMFAGNTLFIISLVQGRQTSVDVQPFSRFPEEEEELLIPGFLFKVTRVEFDSTMDKHIIYLQGCNNQ